MTTIKAGAHGLSVALFLQHTSRSADPQLHTHAIVVAKVQDQSGKWLSLDARFLKRQQCSIGWVYDGALRSELAARLGAGWGAVTNGHADIEGVPAEALGVFSARAAQMRQRLGELVAGWVEDHDGAEPDPRTLYRLERRAAVDSRPAKHAVGDPEALRADWRAQAAAADAAHGRLDAVHPALLPERVARVHQLRTQAGRSPAITTASAGMARDINLAIQRRHHRGQARPSVALADGSAAFAGDRVATRRNDRTRTDTGQAVRNRHTWKVEAVGDDGSLVVSHPARGRTRLSAAHVSRHVELGWAVTGYGTQGDTTDDGICVQEPSSTRLAVYVGMTWGRGQNLGLVVDPTGMADPEEAFAAVIARPANARTALAVRDLQRGPEAPTPAVQHEAPPPATDPAPADDDHAARMAWRLSEPAVLGGRLGSCVAEISSRDFRRSQRPTSVTQLSEEDLCAVTRTRPTTLATASANSASTSCRSSQNRRLPTSHRSTCDASSPSSGRRGWRRRRCRRSVSSCGRSSSRRARRGRSEPTRATASASPGRRPRSRGSSPPTRCALARATRPPYGLVVRFAAVTGLRPSELCGMICTYAQPRTPTGTRTRPRLRSGR